MRKTVCVGFDHAHWPNLLPEIVPQTVFHEAIQFKYSPTFAFPPSPSSSRTPKAYIQIQKEYISQEKRKGKRIYMLIIQIEFAVLESENVLQAVVYY